MTKPKSTKVILPISISQSIYSLRNSRVMLDFDLACLYSVTTSSLNQAVQRNLERFPEDFMFRLKKSEFDSLIFQSGISKPAGRGGSRHLPFAFTEQGVAMLSSVLRSDRAVKVNIAIMRAFVQLREMLVSNQQLRRKIEEMEKGYDAKFQIVFAAIKRMLETPKPVDSAIGFHAGKDRKSKADPQSSTRFGRKNVLRASGRQAPLARS